MKGPCGTLAPAGHVKKLCSARQLCSSVLLYRSTCCRELSAPSLRWRSSRGRLRLAVNSKLSMWTRLTGDDEDEARDDFKEESRKYRRTVSPGTVLSCDLAQSPSRHWNQFPSAQGRLACHLMQAYANTKALI